MWGREVSLEALARIATTHPNIQYDTQRRLFTLKSKYPIHDKEELLTLLITHKEGIVKEEELLNAYHQLGQDLDMLKNSGALRELPSNEGKKVALFGIDVKDPIERVFQQVPAETLATLRGLWKEIPNVGGVDRNQALQDEGVDIIKNATVRRPRHEDKKELKRKRQHKARRDKLFEDQREED